MRTCVRTYARARRNTCILYLIAGKLHYHELLTTGLEGSGSGGRINGNPETSKNDVE